VNDTITGKQPLRTRPARSRDTDFFWHGLKEHKLLLQKCSACGEMRHPPTPVCPTCHSFEIEYVESTGKGTVYTYTVHHYPPIPGFTAPFAVVVVDLEEGVRMVANLDMPVDEVHIGQPVVVYFEDQPDDWTVPVFRPVS
jgi:uncharacterized OB-fold protein